MDYDEVMSHLDDLINRGPADGRFALVAFRDYLRERESRHLTSFEVGASELGTSAEVESPGDVEVDAVTEPVVDAQVHDEPVTSVVAD